jgi:hypothetical protein
VIPLFWIDVGFIMEAMAKYSKVVVDSLSALLVPFVEQISIIY